MIAGFSDFSLRVVYEAIERWDEIVDDAEAAGVSTDALVSALEGAAASEPAATAATVELIGLLSEVAEATDDASDAAKSTLEAAAEAIDSAATEPKFELAVPLLIAAVTSESKADESAKVEDVQRAVKRVFKGYEWVAKYQAMPGPSMGWQSLVDARQEEARREHERRGSARVKPPGSDEASLA
jgi:N-acyl-D-aspartate/D-glutamate deacylase